MASATAVRSIRDAVADQNKPTVKAPNAPALNVINDTFQRIPHIQAPSPAPAGAVILSATLTLTQKGAASSGNRTLSLRRITASWREGRLTWKNRPARTGTVTDAQTLTGAGSDGRTVTFDVTDDYQAFVDGDVANYGWTIESSSANGVTFYSSESTKHQPVLAVSWSNVPQAPTDLIPAAGGVTATPKPTLRWAFIDLGGDTTLSALQVKIKTTNVGWTEAGGYASPTFDSGIVAAGKPQYDLATSAFAGITDTVWWAVRQRDGAGLWSAWSDPAQITYLPYPTIALLSPGATVDDTTFTWAWTATDQAAFQLLLQDTSGHVVWNSGVQFDAAARDFTQPRGVITRTGTHLVALLRVWDSTDRAAVPGFPAYVQATQAFTYDDSATVDGVAGLTAYIAPDDSDVEVVWTRATVPDQFTIWLDDVHHSTIDGADALSAANAYKLLLHDVPPRISHTLRVKAVRIDGDAAASSKVNPVIDIYTDPVGVRLVDTTGVEAPVVILSEAGTDPVTSDMPETVERFDPVGSSTAVQVTSALRWFEGTVSGFIADYGDSTARETRAALLAMKGQPLVPRVLVWGRNAATVYVTGINVSDVDVPGGERYEVGFAFVAAIDSPEFELQ